MRLVRLIIFTGLLCLFSFAFSEAGELSTGPPAETLLRDTFYLSHADKLEREVFEVEGFTLVPHPASDWNSSFSVVTGFRGNVLTTHILKDVNSVDEARKFFQKNVKPYEIHGIYIRELFLQGKKGEGIKLYWVGNRAFRSLDDAKKSVLVVKKTMEQQGASFEEAI